MDKRKIMIVTQSNFRFKFKVSVSAGNTISPKFTFSAGAPVAKLDWGDGTAKDTLTSDVVKSHTFASTGVYTVSLVMNNCANWITAIDVNTCKISDVGFLSQVTKLRKLILLMGYTNGAMGSLSLSQLPAGMTQLFLYSTTSTITGALNTMPAGMTQLYLNSTTSTITGGATQMLAKALQTASLQNISLSQVNVDDVLSRLATDVAVMTYYYPNINLGPNDAAPSAGGLANKGILTTAGWTVTTTP